MEFQKYQEDMKKAPCSSKM